jgi:RNA polymerase sigma-70 factor (ECF subfamily)
MSEQNKAFETWKQAKGTETEKAAEERLIKALRRYATKICWNILKEANQDVVSASVFQALQFADGFRGDGKFSTWFYSVVKRNCLSAIRKRKRRAEIGIDDLSGAQVKQLPVREVSDDAIALREVTGRLAAHEREFLELKAHGASDEEIARALNIKEGTVRVRWSRLRKKLRGALNGEEIKLSERVSGGM